MILKGKHLGFTLTEISDLLDAEPGRPKADGFTLDEKMVLSQLRHLEERRADLEQAICELRATHQRMTGAAG
jgi:DNA-binding transcriptional MerR regulator